MSRADAGSADAAAEAQPGAVRGLLAAMLEAVSTRLELASVELEIHVLGMVRVLLWALATMLCALAALTFGIVALIAALWDTHRMLALTAGVVTFVLLAAVSAWLAVRAFYQLPPLLAGSIEQLDADQKRTRGTP
jgi:uncharacterized membrane protein YqjE